MPYKDPWAQSKGFFGFDPVGAAGQGASSLWGNIGRAFGFGQQAPSASPIPGHMGAMPQGPSFDMTAWDAANPNPLTAPLTAFKTSDYGAIPEGGPQSTQAAKSGVIEGGMFQKGKTGINLENIFDKGRFPLSGVEAGKELPGAAAKEGAAGLFGSAAAQGGMMAGGALLGGISGYRQAKSQQKGLAKAIGELDPLKTQAFGAYEKMGDLASAYRPGGTYSRYMGGKILSQAEESVGQETSRMIASGITSPSMMRQIGIQSRRQAGASLPGMEMQVSQMALPYEQLASTYFGEYRGLGEQLAGLRGAKEAVDPWSSAMSGAMSGAMGAATMIGSFASDRRMKKDIKYLHTSNEGHKVYSFKYKDGDTRYSGVMAQDVLKINPNAVTLKNGMLAVYYDMIDVDMQQLDIIQ